MNLLKAQDLLKGVPDQKLTEMLQSPQGDVPQYLVAAEAARRAKMRKEFQEDQTKPPQTTVTQDLLNELGVASLKPPGTPQPGQQQPQMQPPQMPAAPQQPVQMYDGGIVAFAQGGMPSMEDVESYLAPRADGSEMGFAASVAPYIPALDARVRAGVLGNTMQGNPQVSGYQVGYEDGVNSVMANIIPNPAGNIVGGEYRRQLGNDAELALRGNVNPYGEMPAMDFRQAPVSVEYTKRFDKGGIASFQEGGYTDTSAYQPSYASNIQIPQMPGFDEFMSQVKTEFGSSQIPAYREEIQSERAKLQEQAPDKMADFLKYIGRGLAASQRTNPLGAIAEGVTSGLTLQEQALQKNKEAQRLLRQSEVELAQKERAEKMGIFGLAKQLENSAADRRNSAINQSYQAQQLALTAKHYEGVESDAAERRGIDLRRLGLEGRRVDLEAKRIQQGEATAGLERQIKELTLKRLQTGELDPSDKSRVLVALSKAKSELVGALSLDPKYNKDIESIKKKYPDPLIQQRAIQQYMRQYYDSAGISELEALLNPTPIK